MNAVEKLQAAIDKLETLKAESTPGPWIYGGQGWLFGSKRYTDDEMGDLFGAVNHIDEDGVLIVTLHRTIDAQLAILRTAKHYVEQSMRHGFVEEQAVALADAILGEE